MRGLFIIGLLGSGCFNPTYGNGAIKCAAGDRCPSGYHCASDRTCWRNGTDPPRVFSPGPVFISGGGGSGSASSGAELNLSFGMWSQPGLVTSAGGATLTFGDFAEDTVP
jgi:hypothetical protein